jgi:hypothetical protein
MLFRPTRNRSVLLRLCLRPISCLQNLTAAVAADTKAVEVDTKAVVAGTPRMVMPAVMLQHMADAVELTSECRYMPELAYTAELGWAYVAELASAVAITVASGMAPDDVGTAVAGGPMASAVAGGGRRSASFGSAGKAPSPAPCRHRPRGISSAMLGAIYTEEKAPAVLKMAEPMGSD